MKTRKRKKLPKKIDIEKIRKKYQKIDGKKRITIKFIKSTLHTRKKRKASKRFSIYEENNGFYIMS